LRDARADRADERRGRDVRAHRDAAVSERELPERNVHGRILRCREAAIPNRADDADDLPRTLIEAGLHFSPDGRLWEVPPRERLVDDGHRRGTGIVAVRERPPGEQRNVECVEVPFAGDLDVADETLVRARGWPSFDRKRYEHAFSLLGWQVRDPAD